METPKALLLHVDDNEACIADARLAQRLAERFDAQVTALYAVTPSVVRYPASAAMDSAWVVADQLVEFDKQQRAKAKIRFVTAQKELPRVRWSESVVVTAWDFPQQAMYSDLVVMRGAEPADKELPSDFAATVAIESGRPVLVLPSELPADVGTNVLIAWKPSREAVRAVSAALPWLRQARRVHLAAAETHDESGAASVVSLSRYLSAHGVECTRSAPIADTRDAGPAITALAGDLGADLLVMGCYGHSRTREWLLGGTTASMTREPALPVLMAH
ncbi:MAG TPA: universal stress protein [Rhizobacter sp.]|nr:universal stress protein [Rhizobacter sp.]